MKNADHDFTMPPFPGFPSVSRYVPIGPVKDTVERITRSILGHEAISLVIGPPGTGKSLVCGLIAKQFLESHDVVVLGETSISDESSFQRFLLHRLGVAFDTSRPQDLDLMLSQRLTGPESNPNGLILIIDEAASLSVDVLEAIRRATNVMKDGQPMVSAVVAGNNKLDETLTAPSLESFVQRVAARCYLHPLNLGETQEYIYASIQACDSDPMETITEGAIAAIHHATGGVSRLINQMMTEAIDCAAEDEQTKIDESTINRAWSNLQQLPSPMVDTMEFGAESSSVEFGELAPAADSAETPIPPSTEPVTIADEFGPSAEAEPAMPTPQPAMLFGEFDSEEMIDVCQPTGVPVAAESGLDLESMLHSEIVSLSHFAAENTDQRDTLCPEPIATANLMPAEPKEMPGESAAMPGEPKEMLGESEAMPANALSENGPQAGVVWYEETPTDPSEEAVRSDDSDLLWISEDVEVERSSVQSPPPVAAHRIDPPVPDAPKLNVDYRELLEKMRKA